MANIEKCLLELRLQGYPARMERPPENPRNSLDALWGESLIVRGPGFTVRFSETLGISLHPLLPRDAIGIYEHSMHRFTIYYPFDNQSFLFSMEDDAFVECILRHVREATEVVSALPDRIRPR